MRDPARSVRVIVFFGIGVFALLWLSSLGLRNTLTPDESQRIGSITSQTAFSGARAMDDVESLCALGPRPPRSPALAEAVQRYRAALESVGLTVSGGTDAPLFSALCRGSTPETVVVLARFDTAADSPGANASASASAVLLETARQFGRSRRGLGVTFVWTLDALAPGTLPPLLTPFTPKAVFVLEGVGDCYLEMAGNPNAPAWLLGLVADAAERFNTARHFPRGARPAPDPYGLRTELPIVLYLTDLQQGGSLARHAQLYNKAGDLPENLCVDSLQAVGDLLYHAIEGCDNFLARVR